MTGVFSQEEKIFISLYYDSLCNDTNRLLKLYTNETVSTLSFENGSTNTFSDGLTNQLKNITGKPVIKVFISNMISQRVDVNIFNISVVGQFVFIDKNQKRFTHNFVVQRDDKEFIIKFETLILLNEEIVYEKINNFCVLNISNKNKSMSQVLNILEKLCIVEEIKLKNEDFECKIAQLDVKIEDLISQITNNGLIVKPQ